MLAVVLLALGACLFVTAGFLWCLPAGVGAAGITLAAVGWDLAGRDGDRQ